MVSIVWPEMMLKYTTDHIPYISLALESTTKQMLYTLPLKLSLMVTGSFTKPDIFLQKVHCVNQKLACPAEVVAGAVELVQLVRFWPDHFW